MLPRGSLDPDRSACRRHMRSTEWDKNSTNGNSFAIDRLTSDKAYAFCAGVANQPPKKKFISVGHLKNNLIWVVVNQSTCLECLSSSTMSVEWELPQDLIFSFWEVRLCNPPYVTPIIDCGPRMISEKIWV